MPTFSNAKELFDYLFDDTLENDEGELYVILKLLEYMTGYLHEKNKKTLGIFESIKKRELITFNSITPKGWSSQKTYCYLFILFKKLGIRAGVVFHQEIYRKYHPKDEYNTIEGEWYSEVFKKDNADYIFQEPCFFLQDDVLEFIEIKNDFDTQENIDALLASIDRHIASFVGEEVSEKYHLISHEKQRNLLISKLSDFYSLVGDWLTISDKLLSPYEGISLMYMVVLLWRLDYIHIFSMSATDETPITDKEGKYLHEQENLSFRLSVTDKGQELFKGLFTLKNLILDKVFDDEYKNILIIKKGGEVNMIEVEKEVEGDSMKFVDLKKQYPFSDITAVNHRGNTVKYKIKEKIKIDKNHQE